MARGPSVVQGEMAESNAGEYHPIAMMIPIMRKYMFATLLNCSLTAYQVRNREKGGELVEEKRSVGYRNDTPKL
jgi:hypothetical protein